ncbi:hypothetical protein BN135_2178 [Cronobacter muytjensii 530]
MTVSAFLKKIIFSVKTKTGVRSHWIIVFLLTRLRAWRIKWRS